MKNLQLLTWLTQLGLSTAVPLAGFILLAVWLKNRFGLGNWVLFLGIGLGVFSAIDGFYKSLKALENLTKEKKKDKPPISFSEHD
jgi:hypothetical protein